jgi:hypothetical protein
MLQLRGPGSVQDAHTEPGNDLPTRATQFGEMSMLYFVYGFRSVWQCAEFSKANNFLCKHDMTILGGDKYKVAIKPQEANLPAHLPLPPPRVLPTHTRSPQQAQPVIDARVRHCPFCPDRAQAGGMCAVALPSNSTQHLSAMAQMCITNTSPPPPGPFLFLGLMLWLLGLVPWEPHTEL